MSFELNVMGCETMVMGLNLQLETDSPKLLTPN